MPDAVCIASDKIEFPPPKSLAASNKKLIFAGVNLKPKASVIKLKAYVLKPKATVIELKCWV